mgnify:FL=1
MRKDKDKSIIIEQKTFEVRPGYVVVDTSTATGGITYVRRGIDKRAINHGAGIKTRHETVKEIDHVEAVAAVDAVVKAADYACRCLCTRTTFGYFVEATKLGELQEAFHGLRAEAERVNANAVRAGSQRRVHVGLVLARLEIGGDAAIEIAHTIRSVLTEVHGALRRGAVKNAKGLRNELHAPLLRCRNLERLTVGIAGEAVRLALRQIPVARGEILERLKAGDDAETAGAKADLGYIEAAVAWFEESQLGNIDDEAEGGLMDRILSAVED